MPTHQEKECSEGKRIGGKAGKDAHAMTLIGIVLLIFIVAIHFSPKQDTLPKTIIVGNGDAQVQQHTEIKENKTSSQPETEVQKQVLQTPQLQSKQQQYESVTDPVIIQVTLRGFVPADLIVPIGTTVVWNETVDRPVAIEDYKGHFRSKFGLGKNFTYRFDTEGEYVYRDLIINWRGRVRVVSTGNHART